MLTHIPHPTHFCCALLLLERQTERDRQRQRETDRQRQRQRERQTDRDNKREKSVHTSTHTHTSTSTSTSTSTHTPIDHTAERFLCWLAISLTRWVLLRNGDGGQGMAHCCLLHCRCRLRHGRRVAACLLLVQTASRAAESQQTTVNQAPCHRPRRQRHCRGPSLHGRGQGENKPNLQQAAFNLLVKLEHG